MQTPKPPRKPTIPMDIRAIKVMDYEPGTPMVVQDLEAVEFSKIVLLNAKP